jgi:glycosyltransferase involved in cell wall biosynthesis
MSSPKGEPLVLILMGTFNGQRFIRDQLDSIASQTHNNWKLVISDDGSTDRTLEIARCWAKEVGEERVILRSGPQQGFARNFLSLASDKSLKADFYAFSDQDDIWRADKISSAVSYLREAKEMCPSLCCGRTAYIGKDSEIYALSPLFKKRPCFHNALVQNLAGGNTMLFNNQTRDLLEKAGLRVNVAFHDWWTYLLVTGCEGFVFYDETPRVLYRQHDRNSLGGNLGWRAHLVRLNKLLKENFKEWTNLNTAALSKVQHLLSKNNREILADFLTARNSNVIRRCLAFKRLGIYRQTMLGNLGLLIGLLLNKI